MSSGLKQKLTQREAERERLQSQAEQLQKLVVKVTDIPRVTDAMIDEWIDYLREALEVEERKTARRVMCDIVSKIGSKRAKGKSIILSRSILMLQGV
ncbi:MAG TPA: hypothetical protein VHO69_08995 [Phototrophicaceae bacterium]|nr:hypothetical protein [Phototrophicaceae bacterium]